MLMQIRRYAATALLCGGALSMSIASALAQQDGTARAALEAWVADLEAQPQVEVTFESITGNGGQATLTGLVVDGPEVFVVFDPITVTGYRDLPPTGFAFDTFDVDRIQARTPTTEINVVDFGVVNLVVPATGVAYDQKRPMSSILDMLGVITEISMDELSIGRIDIGQFQGGLNSLVSYHNYVVRGLANGRIESTSAGPLVMEAPSPDPMFVLTVDQIVSEDIDITAIAWVLDPTAYVDGDRDWRTMLGHAEYNNIIVEAPDLQLRIRAIEIDDFEMRQAAEPFMPVLEQIMGNPGLSARDADESFQQILVDLVSPWGLGSFRIDGLDLYADDIDRFHIGNFHINQLSLDGLGEIGFADIDIIMSGEGYFRADTIALGGLVMPPEETIKAFLTAIGAGEEPEAIGDIVPELGFIEVAGFGFGVAGELPITLDRLLIGSGGYINALPTEAEIEMRGLAVPLTILDGEIRQVLNRLGFTEFIIDLGIYVDWNEADQVLRFDGMHIAIAGAGLIEASFELGGITREMLDNPEAIEDGALLGITFNWAEIRVRDESVADRLFRWTAEGNDIPAEQYRREFIAGLPVILGFTIDRAIALEISPPIQAFLREPSELVIAARPAEPVPLADVVEALDNSPFALLGMLGVELTTTPLD